jgi:UDP-N-acetylmuramoylalanine--D-glutamate ligase
MDRYANLGAYHLAKHRVFRGCKQVVINRADALTRPLVPDSVQQWTFGIDAPDFKGFGLREQNGERYLAFEREILMPVRELKIAGEHNIANALAALALGHAVNLPMPAMLQTLRTFTGLAHRCQLIGEKNRVRFYDDSKGTNVGATVAAIEGLSSATGKVVLIAGGVGKGAEFDDLQPAMAAHGRAAVLIGEAAPSIENVLKNTVAIERAGDMAAAVQQAARLAQAGDSVLLDAVKNYLETP